MTGQEAWGERAKRGFLASGIDSADQRGHKNCYIDLLHKIALNEALDLGGNETVLDFGCGSGRISYWIAPKVEKVIGLEITPEMIDLAEQNRMAKNVQFLLYDGVHFPVLPYPVDLLLSLWVLQYMGRETLKEIVPRLESYLKAKGKFCLIEQISDNPKMGRPTLKDYLDAFQESKLECLQYYPIRNGRWWLLYLIRYGIMPIRFFSKIARYEILRLRERKNLISYYQDYLFVFIKP
jgi:SAM-dependent methyltransferase